MSELMGIYIQEVKEHLEVLNESLLELEKDPQNKELINKIFRAAHTIKGSSASMGFMKMENLTHGMEDVLQDIRDEKIQIDKKIIELLYVCHDFLENSLEFIINTGNEEDIKNDKILAKLHDIIEEKHSKIQKVIIEPVKDESVKTGIFLNNEDWRKVNEFLKNGYSAFDVTITLKKECVLKSVRAWMIFEDVGTFSNIVGSVPKRPTDEEFRNGTFTFEELEILLVVLTKENESELFRKVSSMVDVEKVSIEPLLMQDNSCLNQPLKLCMAKHPGNFENEKSPEQIIDEIIESKSENVIEINTLFLNDFISSMNEQLEKIDMNVLLLETEPDSNVAIATLFRSFHTLKGIAGFIDYDIMGEIALKTESFLEDLRFGRREVNHRSVDMILGASKLIKKLIDDDRLANDPEFLEKVSEHLSALQSPGREKIRKEKKIGELLVEKGIISKDDVDTILRKQKESYGGLKFGQVAVKEKIIDAEDIIKTLRSQEVEKAKPQSAQAADSGYMRIPTQKIDNLVDMLGELLIFNSLLEQGAKDYFNADDKYLNSLMRMAKIIKDIQNLSMSLRMVSLRTTFQKLMRIGRDTGSELGKKVNVSLLGEETEVDRSVAEKILDPLMHLIRNAISHGIEEEDVRVKSGKPVEGEVCIEAYSKRGSVYIKISDDGKGLDVEKLYEKAKEKNLIDPGKIYSEEDIIKFIFLPGFSTQENINNISGRGVGMNVVETEITKMGGKIDVINKPGEGCSFVLKIPMNLAVMNGTIVSIKEEKYIIPTLYIKQFLKPQENQWISVKGKKSMVRVRDELIPVIPVNEVFGEFDPLNGSMDEMIIIMEVEQQLKALPVRTIYGRQEIVAKPLGKEFSGLNFVSGASILGDGKVSLILDVETLFKFEN
ncbi:MAG: Hpt domain-containing protein [Clostridia bacterium]|nr:Hpt domain-containing protein [Clostridia bacterium]